MAEHGCETMRPHLRVRRNDTVIVLTGNDAGKTGKVLKVIPREGLLLVEGVNRVWKHLRRSQEHPQGARLQREAPLPVSRVMVICQSCNKPTRVRMKVEKDIKDRVCGRCGQAVAPEKV